MADSIWSYVADTGEGDFDVEAYTASWVAVWENVTIFELDIGIDRVSTLARDDLVKVATFIKYRIVMPIGILSHVEKRRRLSEETLDPGSYEEACAAVSHVQETQQKHDADATSEMDRDQLVALIAELWTACSAGWAAIALMIAAGFRIPRSKART